MVVRYLITMGQSNFTKRSPRRHSRTVQSYSPGCANVHPNLIVLSRTHPSPYPNRHFDRFNQGRLIVTLLVNINRPWFNRFCAALGRSPYTLQWAAPSPKKLPFRMGSRPSSNTWFLGPTRVHNPNGISIRSAVFAGITDRATDRPR